MGGITKALFGGSSNKSSSDNAAFGQVKDAFSGNIGTGNSAFAQLGALLGIGGGDPAAADGAFKNYLDSSGYKFLMDSGSKAITGNAAAAGNLNSGATGKALTGFGQNLGATKFDDYLKNLTGLFQGGLQSGSLVAQTGQRSSGKGSSSNGIINSLFG